MGRLSFFALVLLLVASSGAKAASPCLGLHSPPTAITNLGLTCEIFDDGPFSTSDMDLSDTATYTNQAGSATSGTAKWYLNPNFPATAIGAQCPGNTVAASCSATPSSNITIAAGVLTLNRLTAYGTTRIDLTTCKASNIAPLGYFGFTYPTPAYVEFSATYTGTIDSNNGEAAIWSVSTSYLVGGVRVMTGTEIDYLESDGSPGPRHTNYFTTDGLGGQSEVFQNMAFNTGVYGALIAPQWRNPNNDGYTTGLVTDFNSSGVQISNDVLKFGTGSSPTYNGTVVSGSSSGGFSTLNTDKFCLWLGSGNGVPLNLTYIRVFSIDPGPGGGRWPPH